MKNGLRYECAVAKSDKGIVVCERGLFDRWSESVPLGTELLMTIEEHADVRGVRANAYYWGVVVEMAAKDTGQDPDDIHEFWKDQFLPNERKQVEFFHHLTGVRIKVTVEAASTKKLSKAAFYDYVENCRQWLRDWRGVNTPDPDPEYWRKPKRRAA